ncbi:MAG: universal stress protein [Flavobacteriaceae bacterium]|nr:universal stress protein [Flavobacteriaceae bacterium]
MKKILVPIDFSEQAEFATKIAAKIAEQTNSELHLLHMLELPTDVIDPSNYGNADNSPTTLLYMKKAQEQFEKLTKRYFLRNVKIVKSVFFHSTFNGIIEESKKQNVDLIVMGSKGISGLDEILVGSNTERVVRNSDIPVIVVKNEIDDFKIDNIIFASDFKEPYKPGFKKLVKFANEFDAKIHLLRVVTPSYFESSFVVKQNIKKFIADTDLKEHTVNLYNDKTIEEGVLHFGEEIETDVIAINTHKRRGLIHLFNNSISSGITNQAIKPVITFKV